MNIFQYLNIIQYLGFLLFFIGGVITFTDYHEYVFFFALGGVIFSILGLIIQARKRRKNEKEKV